MIKNKITFSGIEDIIDDCVINDKPFMFICDEELAEFIVDFIDDQYGIEVEDEFELGESEEYYVSFVPGENDKPATLYCEDARGISGEYKMDDAYGNYFVFTDMTEGEARKKLLVGDYGFYELVEEDEEECDGDCENCIECDLTDEEKEVVNLIDSYVEKVQETGGCPGCIFDILLEVFYQGRDIGYEDCKEQFRCYIDDLD